MIQKLTPKKFVTDKDERLVAPNEMILAENVTNSMQEVNLMIIAIKFPVVYTVWVFQLLTPYLKNYL